MLLRPSAWFTARVWASSVALLVVALCALASGCRGESRTSEVATGAARPPLAVESPTPSPTPPPPDPALAETFRHNGQYDEAEAVYEAIIERGTARMRQNARLSLAQLLLDEERYEQARGQLEAYLEEALPTEDVAAARYLLAAALAAVGETDRAILLYEEYIAAGGGASVYAQMERARLLAQSGRSSEAEAEAEEVLAAALPESARRSFILALAQAHEEGGALAEARGRYEQLFRESPVAGDRALALWRSAAIRKAEGDIFWSEDALAVVSEYPATGEAAAALEELLAEGVPVDAFSEGLVLYYSFENEEAERAFERYLSQTPQGPRAGDAIYYLAALAERRGDAEAALEGYAQAQAASPDGDLADDALWWRGRLLESLGRLSEADTAYQQLAALYAGSEWAADASFRRGLVRYKQGFYEEAAQVWTATAETAEGEEAVRALFWAGKAEMAAGSDQAQALLGQVTAATPDGYYGLRAAALLAGEGGDELQGAGEVEFPEEPARWAEADAWLTEALGADPAAAVEWILLDPRWGRGQELLALGMRREASRELTALLDDASGDPAALYELARAFEVIGMTDLSARAAARLLGHLPSDVAATAPRQVLRLAYPVDYTEPLLEVAEAEEVPPLLLLALIRQESFFDPLAGSSAGALGLTQVIPPTAEEIAERLGVEGFETHDLFRPVVSLRFGASYLSDQLDTFEGNLYHALAAYNGGPGNARRWRDASQGDVDLFVEEIDLGESALFVKRVMGHLARYRQVYEGLEGPALPAAVLERD